MWYTHVLLTIGLCLHLQVIRCTDLSVVYKHNIYHVKHADANSPPAPRAMLAAPMHYPVGLVYAGTSSKGAQKGPLLLVSDTNSGQASVFGVVLGSDQQEAAMEPIIKRSSISRDHLAFDRVKQSLYLSSSQQTGSLGVSQLPDDMSSKWADQPSLLARAREGSRVRGLAVDPCNRVLYWSEGDGLNASVVRRRALDGGGEEETLLQAAPGTHYQSIHYDPRGKSLLVAVTNSNSSTLSSCSFLSVRTLELSDRTASARRPLDSNAKRDGHLDLFPGVVADGVNVETIAPSQDDCFPYALTADERFLYYTDWARQGLMRLGRGAAEGDATRLVVTPGVQSQVGWHPGAMGVIIIPEEQREGSSEENCGGAGNDPMRIRATSDVLNQSRNRETSNDVTVRNEVVSTTPKDSYYPASDDYYTAVKEDESYLYADYRGAAMTASTVDNIETTENTNVKSEGVIETTRDGEFLDQTSASSAVDGAASPQGKNGYHQRLLDVRSSTLATTETDGLPTAMDKVEKIRLGHAGSEKVLLSVEGHPSKPYDFSIIGSLSRGQLETVVLCLSAACCLFFIISVLLALKLWTLRGYPGCGTGYTSATNSRPSPCGGRGIPGTTSSYYSQHNNSSSVCNGTAGNNDHKQKYSCNDSLESSSDVTRSTTDVIIDLSQDIKCGDGSTSPSGGASVSPYKWNDSACLSSNQYSKKKLLAGKPKKRFGPSKGGIKHLISKSFTGGSNAGVGGGYCPGLQRSDDDGVLLNIEDCCQMTLCDTPCYSSVRKEGKRYPGGRVKGDDKQGLLDNDDDIVPSTDC